MTIRRLDDDLGFEPDDDLGFVADAPPPRAPEPNPDAVDAGAPFDPETSMLPAPVARAYNYAIPKMEALAVGAADLIPGATSTLRGLQGAAEGAGKPEGVVGGFQRGQREAQEQRARVATDDPVLYAIPQVASLAVPSPAGKTGVVGKLLSPAGRAATAGVQSLAEGDGLDNALFSAGAAGFGGKLMGSENRAARVVGTLGSAGLAGRTAFDSNAPQGERLVAIANMLAAGASLPGTGAPKQRRAAADDAQRADAAREQAARGYEPEAVVKDRSEMVNSQREQLTAKQRLDEQLRAESDAATKRRIERESAIAAQKTRDLDDLRRQQLALDAEIRNAEAAEAAEGRGIKVQRKEGMLAAQDADATVKSSARQAKQRATFERSIERLDARDAAAAARKSAIRAGMDEFLSGNEAMQQQSMASNAKRLAEIDAEMASLPNSASAAWARLLQERQTRVLFNVLANQAGGLPPDAAMIDRHRKLTAVHEKQNPSLMAELDNALAIGRDEWMKNREAKDRDALQAERDALAAMPSSEKPVPEGFSDADRARMEASEASGAVGDIGRRQAREKAYEAINATDIPSAVAGERRKMTLADIEALKSRKKSEELRKKKRPIDIALKEGRFEESAAVKSLKDRFSKEDLDALRAGTASDKLRRDYDDITNRIAELRQREAERSAASAGATTQAPPDYARADADIASAPQRIEKAIFESAPGAQRLPRKLTGMWGFRKEGNEIDLAKAAKSARGGDASGAAKEASRLATTSKLRAAARAVEDVVGGPKQRSIATFWSQSGDEFADPAAAAAIYRALSASNAPSKWKNIASQVQDGLPVAALRSWILRNKDAEAAIRAEMETKKNPRAAARENIMRRARGGQ